MISISAITTALACWAATHVASLLVGSGASTWQESREQAIQRDRLKWLEQVRAEEAAKKTAEPVAK